MQEVVFADTKSVGRGSSTWKLLESMWIESEIVRRVEVDGFTEAIDAARERLSGSVDC